MTRRLRRVAPSVAVIGVMLILAFLTTEWRQEWNRSSRPHRVSPDAAQQRVGPNVILITFCTLRADRLGAYGHRRAATPNIDALAAAGSVFLNHYTQAVYSGGSFASIIVGRYPFRHGIYDHPQTLDPAEETLAEIFRDRGYATGAFLTHIFTTPKHRYDQGFDWYNGAPTPPPEAARGSLPDRAGHANRRIEEALDWIDDHQQQSFFVWLQTGETHYPYYRLPRRFIPSHHQAAFDSFLDRTRNETRSKVQFDFDSLETTAPERDAIQAYYDAKVAVSDAFVGEILDRIVELGLDQQTVVVVGADHGEALGEHGLYLNHDANLYEPTVRVPLIIRAPGMSPAEIDTTTRNIDIFPTLLQLVGMAPPDHIDGVGLVDTMRGGGEDLPVFSETRPFVEERAGHKEYRLQVPGIAGKLRMIRRGRHKLILFPTAAGPQYELYDLTLDPEEQINLAEQEPALRDRLAEELERWFAGYDGSEGWSLEIDAEDREALQALGYVE